MYYYFYLLFISSSWVSLAILYSYELMLTKGWDSLLWIDPSLLSCPSQSTLLRQVSLMVFSFIL